MKKMWQSAALALMIGLWALTWQDHDPFFGYLMLGVGMLLPAFEAAKERFGDAADAPAPGLAAGRRWAVSLVCALAIASMVVVQLVHVRIGVMGVGLLVSTAGFVVLSWASRKRENRPR